MKTVEPYKSTQKAEPPVRQRVQGEDQNDNIQQRMRSVVHALTRANNNLQIPEPQKQQVPGFGGFFAQMSEPVKCTSIPHDISRASKQEHSS